MKPLQIVCLLILLLLSSACSNTSTTDERTAADHSLPADVISITKPLVGGQLYDEASFEGATLTSFDNAQDLQILDTSDVIFTKVRVRKEEKVYVGFIPKAILPE
ncbi:hypothetical protein [Pontibacter beigongshangensis]|uniref:hypothetical protein n=1 Tax=Pontibacter beigongshangensis TaxID=2574733 RepID=UPI00164FEA54|nr:hypothetical protein [Pontibacter beigongshangensis]